MNYPNLPNSALEITSQPEVKEITNELLKQLQNALKNNALFTEQVEQINRNKSEFIFKTMFKEKGDYKNAPDYEKNIKEND